MNCDRSAAHQWSREASVALRNAIINGQIDSTLTANGLVQKSKEVPTLDFVKNFADQLDVLDKQLANARRSTKKVTASGVGDVPITIGKFLFLFLAILHFDCCCCVFLLE